MNAPIATGLSYGTHPIIEHAARAVKIALEKAYFGGRIIDGETFNFDGELGRRNLGDVFESKINQYL